MESELVKRTDISHVPFSRMVLEEGLNLPGRDEDLEELAESLYQNGARVALKGYKRNHQFVVVVGHRRFGAAAIVKDRYKKDLIFPMITYKPGITAKEILIEHFLTNDGKPLTPLQKAYGVKRLLEEKMLPKDIAKLLGISEVYVGNLKKLAEAPAEAQELVKKNLISSTLLIQELKRKGADMGLFIKRIAEAGMLIDEGSRGQAEQDEINKANRIAKHKKKAAGEKVKDGGTQKPKKKTAKVTSKKLKVNSIKEMKSFIKKGGKETVAKNRLAIFSFVDDMLQNKYDYQDILNFFSNDKK
jgi:ParB-like chromosome segregation protein Spo0J